MAKDRVQVACPHCAGLLYAEAIAESVLCPRCRKSISLVKGKGSGD